MPPVYADHGSEAFHRWMEAGLEALTRDVEAALGDRLVALILGGGYGRGEGGVVTIGGEQRAYNDLDLTLIIDRHGPLPEALERSRHAHEQALGIEVDFSRPLTVEDVRRWPATLMWHDLLNGHIVLSGPADVLTANAPARVAEPPPMIEGTRLLLNRGAGLLWALRVVRGLEPAPDADFVRRNGYKARLAAGDAALIAHGRFTTAYRGRDERLAALDPEVGALVGLEAYRDALRFKFSPDELPSEHGGEPWLRAEAAALGATLLHVEQLRCGRRWDDLAAYARWGGVREPAQAGPARWARNLVRNLQLGRLSLRYPREQLYRELPALLGLTGAVPEPWAELSEDFLARWRRFN